ncbi:MAG: hypothetical protein DRH70_04335, partial [Candidatus Coatesbacteria bacterium]
MRLKLMKAAYVSMLIIALLAISAATSLATDYYVDGSNGDDSNSGLRAQDAWKTITHALQAVEPSASSPATIHVAAGTYAASTNGESFPLVLNSYTALVGEGPGTTVLDAEHLGGIIRLEGASQATITSLCLDRASGDPALYCCDTFITVTDCHIQNNREAEAIFCRSQSKNPRRDRIMGSLTLRGCRINNNAARHHSIISKSGLDVLFALEWCAIEGNTTSRSIITHSGALIAHGIVESCTIRGNTASAAIIYACGYFNYLDVSRCLIERNSCGSVIWASGVRLLHSIIRDNHADRVLDLYDYYGVFRGCVIESNEMRAELFRSHGEFGWLIAIPELFLDDCLIARNTCGEGALFKTVDQYGCRFGSSLAPLADSSGSGRIQIHRCSMANNHGGARDALNTSKRSIYGVGDSIDIQDCVFQGNAVALHHYYIYDTRMKPWPCNVDHCCLEEEFEGEGNFVADPM